MRNKTDYWRECMAQAAEECGIIMTEDQLADMALAAQMGHYNYGMWFYEPSASDRISDIENSWRAKLREKEQEMAEYRSTGVAQRPQSGRR